MKRSIIIISSIFLIAILAIRAIYVHIADLNDERRSYVWQLGYDFSSEIDSIQLHNKSHGLVYFHVTKGNVDKNHEVQLNKKLYRNAEILLLEFKSNGTIEIASETAGQYLKGDSVCINTIENRILVFRKGNLITKSEVLPWLRGREF